jgi:hypothetical protein
MIWFLVHGNETAHRALVIKKHLVKHYVTALKNPPYSPDLSAPAFSISKTENVLKEQQRASAEEDTAKATRSLTGLDKWFVEMLPKPYQCWQ